MELRQDIDICRRTIISRYGQEQSNGEFHVKSEYVEQANKELTELSSISQEVELYPIPLAMLAEVQLSYGVLSGLMVMITVPDELDTAVKNGQLEELANKEPEIQYHDE